jgi:hypothetical protein
MSAPTFESGHIIGVLLIEVKDFIDVSFGGLLIIFVKRMRKGNNPR